MNETKEMKRLTDITTKDRILCDICFTVSTAMGLAVTVVNLLCASYSLHRVIELFSNIPASRSLSELLLFLCSGMAKVVLITANCILMMYAARRIDDIYVILIEGSRRNNVGTNGVLIAAETSPVVAIAVIIGLMGQMNSSEQFGDLVANPPICLILALFAICLIFDTITMIVARAIRRYYERRGFSFDEAKKK